LAVLVNLIEQSNDATLDELCQMFCHELGIDISRATMGRMTQRLQLTFKKTLHLD
jgi:transposase